MSPDKVFAGYINNEAIVNTLLVSIYKDLDHHDSYYFHELSNDNRQIISFTRFSMENYKRDKLVTIKSIKSLSGVRIGSEPFFVVKLHTGIVYGTYSEVLKTVSVMIVKRDITSKNLISTLVKLYKSSLISELRNCSIVAYSSIKGVSKGRLSDYLNKSNDKKVINIINETDKDFLKFYENIVTTKSKRVLNIPNEIRILVSEDKLVFRHKTKEFKIHPTNNYSISIFKDIPLTEISEVNQNIKVWQIKSKDDIIVYLGGHSDQRFALFVKEVWDKIALTFSYVAPHIENKPRAAILKNKVNTKVYHKL